eukprot:TRINITY_DN2036_c0_g1_i2.p1 TRINITY_DN2036_c0_g1~~TRINITY_DN2036_c0_g1_i2.p1  ORF type:complete len:737 (-),score=215.94 TRINITY_DN2036_c0_g1_i2:67-2277(-)
MSELESRYSESYVSSSSSSVPSDLSAFTQEPEPELDRGLVVDSEILFSDLIIEKEIGSGSFGKVFKGTYFGTEVAIKQLLNPEDNLIKKYVQRELSTLRNLRHPNVVQFMGLAKVGKEIFLVTEFVPHGDVTTALINYKREFNWKTLVKWCLETAQAMAFIHAKGIIHRDLKCSNLLIADNQKIKVCDFGMARLTESDPKKRMMAYAMTICGTDEYMAPEVIMGDEYNESADVFSFGMCLYEIITRRIPQQRAAKDQYRFPTSLYLKYKPDTTPSKLEKLLFRCVQQFAQARPGFKSIVETMTELLKDVDEKMVVFPSIPQPAPPPKPEIEKLEEILAEPKKLELEEQPNQKWDRSPSFMNSDEISNSPGNVKNSPGNARVSGNFDRKNSASIGTQRKTDRSVSTSGGNGVIEENITRRNTVSHSNSRPLPDDTSRDPVKTSRDSTLYSSQPSIGKSAKSLRKIIPPEILQLYDVCGRGDVLKLKEILPKISDVDIPDQNGETALSIGVKYSHPEIVEELLSAGSKSVNYPNEKGTYPLHQACRISNTRIARLLLDNGAKLKVQDEKKSYPLHIACECGNYELVEILFLRGKLQILETCNEQGETPLLLSCRLLHIPIANLLLGFGSDIVTKDKMGRTPMWYASHNKSLPLAELLCKHHAQVDVTAEDGSTALLVAIKNEDLEMATFLIQHGGDVGNFRKHSMRNSEFRKHIFDLVADNDAKSHPEGSPKEETNLK